MSTATMADITDVDISEPRAAPVPVVQQRTSLATTSASLMTIIEVCISRPDFDIEKVQRLLEVKERWEANEARKGFVEAMAGFKREPVEIFKRKHVGYNTKDGDFVGYKHAELSDVTDAIAPAMARHGLSFDWDIHQSAGTITVDCVVTHVLGHSKKVTMSGAPDSSGKKNQIQQVASTITYLQRYTLLAATGMSTKNDDDDGAGGADDDDKGGQKGTDTPAANAARAGASSAPADRPMYDQVKFETNAAEWKAIIANDRKTPAQLIALIETKGATLTADQRDTIDSWSQK